MLKDSYGTSGSGEPEPFDLSNLALILKTEWKTGIWLIAICAVLLGILRPGTTETSYHASCTFYIPPYTQKQKDGEQRVVSNHFEQLDNAIALTGSRKYQEKIVELMQDPSGNIDGSFHFTRADKTDLVSITVQSSSLEKAESLCQAVLKVFEQETAPDVSISSIKVVNPISGYTQTQSTSTLKSVVIGALVGGVLYFFYAVIVFFMNRRFKSKQDVEKTLDIPVLVILPEMEKAVYERKKRDD